MTRYLCEEMENWASWIEAGSHEEAVEIYLGIDLGNKLTIVYEPPGAEGETYAVYDENGDLCDHIWVKTEDEEDEFQWRLYLQKQDKKKRGGIYDFKT